jgi:hypothetical protein
MWCCEQPKAQPAYREDVCRPDLTMGSQPSLALLGRIRQVHRRTHKHDPLSSASRTGVLSIETICEHKARISVQPRAIIIYIRVEATVGS